MLPKFSYFGDYQILFKLKSIFNYKTYLRYDRMRSPTENERRELTTVFMCLDAKIFLNLCELYPKTATNLKFRSLERRQQIKSVFRAQKAKMLAMGNTMKSTPNKALQSLLKHKILKGSNKIKLRSETAQPVEVTPGLMTGIDLANVDFFPEELINVDTNETTFIKLTSSIQLLQE